MPLSDWKVANRNGRAPRNNSSVVRSVGPPEHSGGEMKRAAAALSFVTLVGAIARPALGQGPASNGEALFNANCASCHTGAPGSRAPGPEVLRQRSAAGILDVLAH